MLFTSTKSTETFFIYRSLLSSIYDGVFHKNSKMVSVINYFLDKAPSQISDSVLNMPPISMVTEKLYLVNNTGQPISLTSKFAFAESLFYIFQVFLFSLFSYQN